MIKIILTITQLLQPYELPEKAYWSEAIDNVQDQMTWIREDINNGRITEEQAELQLENLERTEDLLIELYNINTNK
jgi:benzoyl-CoA reductase/2-hydroxyglutaryl-CoA dehydratase subunit BcrC/BadD/HgdB